jgi:hypothetical protein
MVELKPNEKISNLQQQEWRKRYQLKRDFEHFSEFDITKRIDDILRNLLLFTEDGSPTFDQTVDMKGFIQRLIHLDEEMILRGNPINVNLLEDASRYLCEYPSIHRAIRAWGDRKLMMSEYLVKFGKRGHLTQMMDAGKIRVNPASFYDDPSLNLAIRDKELEQRIYFPKDTKLKRQMDSGNYEEIKGILNISLTVKSSTDFYVYCLTKSYQHRLFDDFNADACLLIREKDKFLRRFIDHFKKVYSDWLPETGEVQYYDPFLPPSPSNIPFNKHFRFWYQGEFRIVFKPKNPVEKLEPIDLDIGRLDDCCELILL